MADVMQYREVRQRFSVRDDDGPDSDLHPDKYTVTGTVEFTPKLPKGDVLAYPEEFVKPMPITGRIVAGELFANWVVSDQEEPRPLYLPVTVDDEADQTWSWVMRVSSLLIDGQEASIKMGDREFQVEAGEGPLWLSTVAAVAKGSGAIATRGPRGYGIASIAAEDGELVFQWDNGPTSRVPIPDAVQGPPGTISGSLTTIGTPPYAGTNDRTWEPSLSLYNGESEVMREARALIRKGLNGERVRMVCAGPSTVAGTGGAEPMVAVSSFPAQLIDLLGARPGRVMASTYDNRWEFSGAISLRSGTHTLGMSSSGSFTATYTSREAATGYTLYAYRQSATDLTVAVDGGSPQTIPLPGLSSFKALRIDGLADTTHTIAISGPGSVFLDSIEADSDGLTIHNAGRPSSSAADWISPQTTSSWSHVFATTFAAESPNEYQPKPEIALIQPLLNGSQAAEIRQVVANVRALDIPTVLVTCGGVGGMTGGSTTPTQIAALYDAADEFDLPLIDLTDTMGWHESASAKGLMNDTVHPNRRGYSVQAWRIYRALIGA